MPEKKHDPGNYRKLSDPRTIADTDAALSAFWDEFYELRNKHGLPDVYVVFRLPVIDDRGEEGVAMTRMTAGSEVYAESMIAWAFGMETAVRQERIAGLAKGGSMQQRGERQKSLLP